MRILSSLILCASALSAANFNTYIGDSYTYNVSALTTDTVGNTYVTGSRNITANSTDVFVSKIDPAGNVTLLATLAGKGSDTGSAIAVDSNGNIFVAGNTSSPDFPLSHPLQSLVGTSPSTSPFFVATTGFLTKLSPNGAILFSTYLGGTKGSSAMTGLAVDSGGAVYVAGTTNASDYPTTSGLPAGQVNAGELEPISAAWFAKISADGSKILYAGGISTAQQECGEGSSCFLSPIYTSGVAVAVDSTGNAYIAGNTDGGLTGTSGALQTSGTGGFVFKVNAAGNALVYMTLLGQGQVLGSVLATGNSISAMTLDATGDVYLAGSTNDANFPATSGAFQSSLPGVPGQAYPSNVGFAAKLNSTGSAMIWASFLGGSSYGGVRELAVDGSGDAWVSGSVVPNDFGVPAPSEFLAEFNSAG